MCHADNEKRKRETTKGLELLNKERIGTLGEKENYKYVRILEPESHKQVEMKE